MHYDPNNPRAINYDLARIEANVRCLRRVVSHITEQLDRLETIVREAVKAKRQGFELVELVPITKEAPANPLS